MKITKSLVESAYARLNAEIFGNTLPSVPIRIGRSKRKVGSVRARHTGRTRLPNLPKALGLRIPPEELEILGLCISEYFDLSQENLELILIHEMIHVELFAAGIMKTSGGDIHHGVEFMKRVNELNQRLNIRIPIVDESGSAPREEFCKKLDVVIYKASSESEFYGISIFREGLLSEALVRLKIYLSRREICYVGQSSSKHIQLLPENMKISRKRPTISLIRPSIAEEIIAGYDMKRLAT